MASVGFRGDDIDSVFARDRVLENPSEGGELFERFEPSEVYDCEREREAIGTVKLSTGSPDLSAFSPSTFGSSVSGGRSWKAAYSCASDQSSS